MVVETLVLRARIRRPSAREIRDGLIDWFVRRAEPQVRRAMRFTAPDATDEDVRRLLHHRALVFFERIASPYDDPTWADLRRVQARMLGYLLPRRKDLPELRREAELWERLLGGGTRRTVRARRATLAPLRIRAAALRSGGGRR